MRVYLARGDGAPAEVPPPPSPRKYWTRKGIAEWLVERLAVDVPTLVGIDHGFSFPLRYFEAHGLLPDWPRFLGDFQRHWPTDEDHVYVEFIRNGVAGNGAARMGNARWRSTAHAALCESEMPGRGSRSATTCGACLGFRRDAKLAAIDSATPYVKLRRWTCHYFKRSHIGGRLGG